MYGSGSGSCYHQAKILRKTLIPTFYYFLPLKNDVNVTFFKKAEKQFFVGVLKVDDEMSRIQIRSQIL
jgi:hypothetical protein